MGYFQAYVAKTGLPVNFTNDGRILPGVDPNTATPAARDYYLAIFMAVFPNCTLVGGNTIVITRPSARAKTINQVLINTLDVENRYFWKWLNDDRTEVKNADDKPILNKLEIVNTYALSSADNFGASLPTDTYRNQVEQQVTPGLLFGALPLTNIISATEFRIALYDRLLFRDTDKKTDRFRFKKEGAVYNEDWSYNYDFNYTTNIGNTPGFAGVKTDAQYWWGDRASSFCRYFYALKEACTAVAIQRLKRKQVRSNVIFNTNVQGDGETAIQNTFEIDNATWQQQVVSVAAKAAQELPKSFKCYYFDLGGVLSNFISSVPIREPATGIGYNMRADKVNEVKYHWAINLNVPETQLLSVLMGLKGQPKTQNPGIGSKFYPTNCAHVAVAKSTSRNRPPNSANSLFRYFKAFKKTTTLSAENIIKRNRPKAPDPLPAIPRLTNPVFRAYPGYVKIRQEPLLAAAAASSAASAVPVIKWNNFSYRKWKKKNADNSDLILGTNAVDREDAASIMALALKDYEDYPDMVTKSAGQANWTNITYSKLPATSLVRYALAEDDTFKTEWKKDNGDVAVLLTDQEWCHLLGHGDGGREELGNFVAGSKHCNTEQLAIETGLRRITHSNRRVRNSSGDIVDQNDQPDNTGQGIPLFSDDLKDELTAQITAYLFPNTGLWIGDGKLYSAEAYQALCDSFPPAIVDTYFVVLFNQETDDESGENYYKLKTRAEVVDTYNQLSAAIRTADNRSPDKQNLRNLRDVIEQNFYLPLPIARWMRYRISYNGRVVFDHLYDGQSQSINVHECQMLDFAVERAIYYGINRDPDSGETPLKTQVNMNPLDYEEQYRFMIYDRIKHLILSPAEMTFIEAQLSPILDEILLLQRTQYSRDIPPLKIRLQQLDTSTIPDDSPILDLITRTQHQLDALVVAATLEAFEQAEGGVRRNVAEVENYRATDNTAKRLREPPPPPPPPG